MDNSELRPTIHEGMTYFSDRKKGPDLDLVQSAWDMLKFFEFYQKISYITPRGPQMLLSACPICNGLDPEDSAAALPEMVKVYEACAGHKPGCKLAEVLYGLRPSITINLPTRNFK